MSVRLPKGFSLSVAGDAAPQTIGMTLEHPRDVEPDEVEFWAESVDHLARVISHGGFAGAALDPVASRFEVIGMTQPNARVVQFNAEVAAVDPGTWRVILNLYAAHSEASTELSRFVIRRDGREPRRHLDEKEAITLPYPSRRARLPFDVEHDTPPNPTKNRLVQIEFREPLPDDRAEDCIQALLSWDNILLGGYPEEGEPPVSNATDATEAYLVNPYTVEHPMPNFIGAESAFDVVVALAQWFDRTGSAIAAVRID